MLQVFTQLYERSYQSLEQQRVAVRATVLIGELIHFVSNGCLLADGCLLLVGGCLLSGGCLLNIS